MDHNSNAEGHADNLQQPTPFHDPRILTTSWTHPTFHQDPVLAQAARAARTLNDLHTNNATGTPIPPIQPPTFNDNHEIPNADNTNHNDTHNNVFHNNVNPNYNPNRGLNANHALLAKLDHDNRNYLRILQLIQLLTLDPNDLDKISQQLRNFERRIANICRSLGDSRDQLVDVDAATYTMEQDDLLSRILIHATTGDTAALIENLPSGKAGRATAGGGGRNSRKRR